MSVSFKRETAIKAEVMIGSEMIGMESSRETLERLGDFDETVVRKPIAESWRRCLSAGLDPNDKPQLHVTSHTDLYQRRQKWKPSCVLFDLNWNL